MKTYKTVDEFVNDADDRKKQQIQILRRLVIEANVSLKEHIKWNSLSYLLDGEDRITFNVRKAFPIMVILHMGATRKEDRNAKPFLDDDFGLIEWKSDTRGIIAFTDMADIIRRQEQFVDILKRWLLLR